MQHQLKGVQQVQASNHSNRAFAAILSDGSAVSWGDKRSGGDSRAVQDALKSVQQIQASNRAFAAILSDGSVVTWGDRSSGGDSRAVQDELKGVQQIPARDRALQLSCPMDRLLHGATRNTVATDVPCKMS